MYMYMYMDVYMYVYTCLCIYVYRNEQVTIDAKISAHAKQPGLGSSWKGDARNAPWRQTCL